MSRFIDRGGNVFKLGSILRLKSVLASADVVLLNTILGLCSNKSVFPETVSYRKCIISYSSLSRLSYCWRMWNQ